MFLKEILIAVASISQKKKSELHGCNIDGECFNFDRTFLAFIIPEPYN